MRASVRACLATLIIVALPVPLALVAQISTRLNVGDRLRVTTPDQTLVGELAIQWNDSLRLYTTGSRARSVTVPRKGISKLELARGSTSQLATGVGVGALIGCLAGAGLANAARVDLGSECNGCTESSSVVSGGLIGAAVGALIGGAIGSGIHSDTHWETIPINSAP